MRMRGLEPPRPEGHTDLNRARLPIPPHPRATPILAGTFSRSRTSHPVMIRALIALAAASLVVLAPGSRPPGTALGGPATEVIVTLASPPLARAGAGGAARIAAEQRAFEKNLAEAVPEADVRWRYRIVANGFAVVLPDDAIPLAPSPPGCQSRLHVCAVPPEPRPERAADRRARALGPGARNGRRRREDRDHRHGRRPDPSVLCPSRIHDAAGLPEGAARVHDGQGDRRARIPTAPSRRRRGDSGRRRRTWNPRSRHRRWKCGHQRRRPNPVRGRAARIPRQLQGPDRSASGRRSRRQLARDRGGDRGRGRRRDERDQPLDRRARDPTVARHRRARARRGSRCGRRAGCGRRQRATASSGAAASGRPARRRRRSPSAP